MEKEKRTREEIAATMLEYFKENEDDFNAAVEELDSYNGYLGDNRYYEMEMLDEFYNGVEPSEVLRRAFYGYDEDTSWTDERGERHYGEFNPNRDYFSYNGYGNLVSSDYKDYTSYLDEYAVDAIIENRGELYTLDEVKELREMVKELDALDEEEAQA